MKLTAVMGTVALLGLAAGTGVARAEDNTPGPMTPSQIVRERLQIDETMGELIGKDEVAAGGIQSRLIYLNNCKPGGCTISPGFESSLTNRSSIIDQTANISPFAYSDNVWQQVVQCVRETFAPFNITITDQDPCNGQTSGCTVSHWEDIVAGSPDEAGMDQGVGGVSPWSPCNIINNSITYSFANIYGPSVPDICWTVAQEVAHSWSLDHAYLQNDPMTYLQGSTLPGGFKRFQNTAARCGEYSARNCACSGSTQNSVAEITSLFGAAGPTPPQVSFDDLTSGEQVEPGFIVRTTVIDDNGVASVTLLIDNQTVQTLTVPPYIFNAPSSLGEGTHRVTVNAIDGAGTTGSASVDVNIGPPCDTPADCTGQGENYTCVGGRCVPGEGAPGGLGEACTDNSECYSGQCATAGDESHCVEECVVGGSDCPGGFSCLDAGGTGVCWPGGGDGDPEGGCQSTGSTGATTSSLALGALLGVLFARRRRKRA